MDYNFHPVLFGDLAGANGYEIIRMYGADRNGNVIFDPVPGSEIKKPEPTDKNVMIVCAMRKVTDNAFVAPTQGKYAESCGVGTPKAPVVSPWKGVLIGSMEELVMEPFVHAVGKLPDDLYRQLAEGWPDKDVILDGKGGDNILHTYQAHQSLDGDMPDIWRGFIEYHTSKPFFEELLRWCGPEVFKRHPNLNALPDTCGVRYRDEATVQMEAQFCLDTPSPKTKSVKEMHVDNPLEFYKFLIRFPRDGYETKGALHLGQWTKEPNLYDKKPQKRLAKKADYKSLAVVKDEPGSIVFFLNDIHALHAVEERKSKKYRRYFNVVGECPL